jgi:hypothetical protein
MNRDEQNVGQEVPSMDETGWNEPDASDLNPDTDKNLQNIKILLTITLLENFGSNCLMGRHKYMKS